MPLEEIKSIVEKSLVSGTKKELIRNIAVFARQKEFFTAIGCISIVSP